MFASRHRRPHTLLLARMPLLFLLGTACYSWHPIGQPTPEQFAQHPSAQYQVTTLKGVHLEWRNVRLSAGFLFGVPVGATVPDGLPLSEIATIRRHGLNVTKTIGAGFGGLFVIAMLGIGGLL